MLVGFTAVMMVGCGGGSNKLITACNNCSTDNHTILTNDAATMIAAFHNKFISTGIVANSGGAIDLRDWNDGFVISGFTPLKMHYGFDTTNRTLLLTVEQNNAKCSNGVYRGEEGIESDELLTTSSHVGPISRNPAITPQEVSSFLGLPFTKLVSVARISNSIATTLNYNCNSVFNGDYNCPDIHFYPKGSINEIFSATKNKNIVYFFGYDETPTTFYKIRVILVGLDNAGRLKLTDGLGNSLMRDYSRPYPLVPTPKK